MRKECIENRLFLSFLRRGLLPNRRLLRRPDKLGLLAMTEDTFLCHCEATEGGRGNLKRTDLTLATDPKAGIQKSSIEHRETSIGHN